MVTYIYVLGSLTDSRLADKCENLELSPSNGGGAMKVTRDGNRAVGRARKSDD